MYINSTVHIYTLTFFTFVNIHILWIRSLIALEEKKTNHFVHLLQSIGGGTTTFEFQNPHEKSWAWWMYIHNPSTGEVETGGFLASHSSLLNKFHDSERPCPPPPPKKVTSPWGMTLRTCDLHMYAHLQSHTNIHRDTHTHTSKSSFEILLT